MTTATRPRTASGPVRARRKFLRFFPGGFQDETYLDWERDYKAAAHGRWTEVLDPASYQSLLDAEKFAEIASRAVSIESRTNLLFSFEKMALRDAVKPPLGARAFAEAVRRDQRELKPRDMIDLQSFIWVQGSDEYEE
jgi:hypothetical protein